MKKIVGLIIIATIANVGVNAQEVITLSQGHNVKTAKVTPLYRPMGNDIRIAIGGPVIIGIEYNRWIKPWLMVGAGTGYGMVRCMEIINTPAYTSYYSGYYIPAKYEIGSRVGFGIPWYAEAELRTPKYKWSAFFNLKMGYGVGVKYYGIFKEGTMYCDQDENNNPVYGDVNYDWKPFFMLATAGFGYKGFSMGIGAGLLGGIRSASILIAYDIPLK